ncbi:MAG: CoB--CoM heterodisulfide reductase iron-sulfur subunit B family protein [Proteobacteria bacterium]|nr:CoB--CoM heterodisulfide reductase iron-sulfur subunit B family protein [Pseudomonadota bacterium]MBU1585457.1 CoB--CoM heterodisulfide reductase iron-sulfur subunit B family protein [Pseudomonadota bacterium]MBU2455960.1 CoB--CoM heterodisulfide reductase iron-sulfur subunit B family protein [Pseudomonadota bacterium]MBU2627771.1 CoB--CoM heterodisulfide reductase iron-sulfur subunit B family protein [Pseudomonadota bacterium]
MNYALFLGCNIPARVPQYEAAAKAVLKKLDVGLFGIDEFMCCGYPMRNIDEFVFLVSAARNMALCEQAKKDLLVLCKCCYGSLKMAEFHLKQNQDILENVNAVLAKEDLVFRGTIVIKHFLSVLHEDIGLSTLKTHVKVKFKKLKIAASVGCHALRPAGVTKFDIPAAPTLFDDLVNLTGAKSIDWSKKSECCGAPLLGINDAVSQSIMEKKLSNAKQAGAHFITVACPYSFLQFDTVQSRLAAEDTNWKTLGPVLYPQLLGLAMGIDSTILGIEINQINIASLESYLSSEDDTKEK